MSLWRLVPIFSVLVSNSSAGPLHRERDFPGTEDHYGARTDQESNGFLDDKFPYRQAVNMKFIELSF